MKPLTPPTTLDAKLAQLMTVRIGSNLPPARTVDDDYQRVARLLNRCPIGGLILFNGRWPSTRSVLHELQSKCDLPLLVGADIERGCGQQVHGLGVVPHAMAFDAAGGDDTARAERLAFEFGRVTAAEARATGIHIAFAPVADTNTNPLNPIISTRAFGTDPKRVAVLVAAFVRGCEAEGVAATAKHFPGHGDTQQDSHDSLPEVARDRASIATTELPAFVAAIEAGCSLIMTAHVAYPALDATGTPATLSRAITTDLLRGELGFDGVVCSDSLLMSGVRDRFESEGELCLAALNAGVDLLLDVDQPEFAIDFLMAATRDGRLAEARVDEALGRVIDLKQRVCREPAPVAAVASIRQQTDALASEVALAAMRLVAGDAHQQLEPRRSLTVLFAKPFATPLDPPEQPIAAAAREAFSDVEYFELGPDADPSTRLAAHQAAIASDQLLLAMIVKPAAWHKFGLLDWQQALFSELAAQPEAVVVSFGDPNILDTFPQAASRICAFSDVGVSQRAAIQHLVGRIGQPA